MDSSVSLHNAHPYTITTPVYQGPLDLLLQLIERAELDITRLALAQVTDQFLAHIRKMPELSADEVSAFLVIAAKLIQIKSEALLPRPPQRAPDEEDPGEALARQLVEYRRYKKIADFLSYRQEHNVQTYLRLAPIPKMEGVVDLSDVSLEDLLQAARAVLQPFDHRSSLSSVVAPPPVTIREKIGLIAAFLRQRGRSSFRAFLSGARSRLEIVVTFLAMLELIKLHFVQVHQESTFGDIQVETIVDLEDDEDIDLEFGE